MDFVRCGDGSFLDHLLSLTHRALTFPFDGLRDCVSTKTVDLPGCRLYLFLFSGAESGDAFLFLAMLRGALCILSLNGKFLSMGKSW